LAKTTFTWVKGHTRTLGNKESDKLAKKGAEKEIPELIDIQISTDFDVHGVKLANQSSDSIQGQPFKCKNIIPASFQENAIRI